MIYSKEDIRQEQLKLVSTCRMCKGNSEITKEKYKGRPVYNCTVCGYPMPLPDEETAIYYLNGGCIPLQHKAI